MRRKKETQAPDGFVEVSHIYAEEYDKTEIPADATHFKLEIDYSGCYYQGDMPSYIMHFYKKAE